MENPLGQQNWYEYDLDYIIARLDDLDRINEFVGLLDRAKAKKEGSAEKTLLKDSPLKAIRVLLKMRKYREEC